MSAPARSTRAWLWWSLSLAVHAAVIGTLVGSPRVRAWFVDRPADATTSADGVADARGVLDQLTRKRILAECATMLAVSRQVADLRAAEWAQVEQRGGWNRGYREMAAAGLPALTLTTGCGDDSMDVPALYAHARVLEAQVLTLYEQYKAIGLSLMTVHTTDRSDPRPQSLADSLTLAALERPARPELDRAKLEAPVADLAAGAWLDYKAEMGRASDLAQVMANNCRRVIDVIDGAAALRFRDEKQSIETTGDAYARWTENNVYVGDSLNLEDRVPSDLESVDPKATVTLGRHLGDDPDARAAEWLALDTWWCLGPFPYLGGERTAASLRHAYPPEHGVDLDAVYVGKGGKPLRWAYRPMRQVRMEPREVSKEAIWYFHSEVTSDRARTVWANVASDDFSVLWVNGQEVYSSGMKPRPWVILDQRQFVRITLREGLNTVLLKLDNFRGTTGFSVVLNLAMEAK